MNEEYEEEMKKLQPEPILELKHKYQQGTDSPAWRKKQVGHRHLGLQIKMKQVDQGNSGSDTDENKSPSKQNQDLQLKFQKFSK